MPVPIGSTKARKPTKLKLLSGTAQSSRLNKREPNVSPPTIPDPPPYLLAEEAEAWRRFGSVIDPMRIVTREDFASFELLVVTYAEMVRLRNSLRQNGYEMVYECAKSEGGGTMLRARPEMALLSDVDRRLVNLLGRFGLTPADRSRVSMADSHGAQDPEDEFAR